MAPRSYLVNIDGATYRRNRKFLRSTNDSAAELLTESPPIPRPEEQPVLEPDAGTPQPQQQTTDERESPLSADSLPSPAETQPMKTTRSGRIVKPPKKLDL